MNAKCEQGVMGTKRRERLGESSSGGGEGGGAYSVLPYVSHRSTCHPKG